MVARPITVPRDTMRDPGVIHLVPREAGSNIARCGFDCTGRTSKPKGSANCVVCIDLHNSASRRGA